MLILSRAEVASLLDVDALIDALAAAMADLSAGRASVPPRTAAIVEEQGAFAGVMPAYVPSIGALSTKLVNVFPRNTALPSHQAVIVVSDPETGEPRALLDGTEITALRTAACAALSVRLLARADASVAAIIGTGEQARAHLRAIPRARAFTEVRVAGRDPAKARALADAFPGVVAAETVADACAGADVICACTHAAEPVITRDLLARGTHVTSVGYNTDGREIDGETVRDALLIVESRATITQPPPAGANDIAWAIRDGLITEGHIHAEIGELVSGSKPGRTDDEQLTLYKSVGNAVQDAAAAAMVLREAVEAGVGREVDLAQP